MSQNWVRDYLGGTVLTVTYFYKHHEIYNALLSRQWQIMSL